ncbi:F-box domain, FBD domain, Leucine-rich repeat domain, L domain-like protein [Artemisia annua]|uniref:F-box domain, FBD domain, Leucine-rich repeat domain, L domain-like protein n=1 Tax=Artemisia annua TaxID=35608 RepID=A0A2U1MQ06_ARTAN|nr:F-box domain, FBD domain, Leucine-rich repeat domain, L domain-like protein [Artemisia annua]
MSVCNTIMNKSKRVDPARSSNNRISCPNQHFIVTMESTVKEWIKAAVKRKVKSLDIMFYPGSMTENITMPVCLMTCDSLEVLRLFLYRCTLHMPNHTGFRALKVLELNHIHCYDFDLPKQFIKMCPLLEELSLVECSRRLINVPARISSPKLKILILRNWEKNRFGYKEYCSGIKIDCPELVLLEYVGPIGAFCLNTLDNLKKAVILPEDKMKQKISYRRGDDICETLAGMSHVESLSINLYFIQCVAAHDPNGSFPASFPNLKTLELTTTTDAFTMNFLIRILRCSPNLESLHLIIEKALLTYE